MKKSKTKWAAIVIVALFFVYIAFKFGLAKYLTLEQIKAHGEYLKLWVLQHYLSSVCVYMSLYMVIVAASVPATPIIIMAGGFVFGTAPAVLYSTIAATLGATIAFILFKTVLRATIAEQYANQLVTFQAGLQEHGSSYLLIIHFVFVIPFLVINMLAALAGVPFWSFIWTTAIGFLPCAFVYALAGKKLFSIQSVQDVLSWNVILVIIVLVIVATMPIMVKWYKKRYRGI